MSAKKHMTLAEALADQEQIYQALRLAGVL